MTPKAFESEFLKELDLLNKEQQQKVIAYIRALLKKTDNNHHNLLQFAGSFNAKDIKEISSAIEAGCEKIDRNEW
jgi:hypothetical protein